MTQPQFSSFSDISETTPLPIKFGSSTNGGGHSATITIIMTAT